MAAPVKSADILMVGKTGNGKSALGNMILQIPKAFESQNQLESVTREIQYNFSVFENTAIKVVDGPGVGDTMKDKEKAIRLVVDAMSHAVLSSPDGFHAILLVVRYGGRFTDEDVKTIEVLKGIFGESFVSNHGILVMTCGDHFEMDAKQNNNETFEQWCQKQGGIFSELLKEVNNRAVLFNNRAEGEAVFTQIKKLLQMIEGLCSDGARYTSKVFNEAQLSRDRLVVESKRPLLQVNVIREAGLITQQLSRPERGNPELKELDRLSLLKARAEKLEQTVIEQDKGTNCLAAAIKMAGNLVQTITDQVKREERSIRLREEEEELQRKMEKEKEEEKKIEDLQKLREEEEARKREEDAKKRHDEGTEQRRKEERDRQDQAKRLEEKKREETKRKLREKRARELEDLRRRREEADREKKRELERKMEQIGKDYTKVKQEENTFLLGALKDMGTFLWGSVKSIFGGGM